MMMNKKLALACFFLQLMVGTVLPAAQKPCASGLQLFDRLVTRRLIASSCQTPANFTLKAFRDKEKRTYQAIFKLTPQRPRDFLISTIKIAQAGKLLDPIVYDRAYEAARQTMGERGEDDSRFPRIGKRAMLNGVFVGPGGSMYAVTFTTTDGRFDVNVELGNLLSEGVDDPGFSLYKLARGISVAYDELCGRDHERNHD